MLFRSTSNISTAPPPLTTAPALAEVAPQVDGTRTSYFEWLGAAQVRLTGPVGAMHEVSDQQAWCTSLAVAFDGDSLVLALSGARAMRDLLGTRYRIQMAVTEPTVRNVSLGPDTTDAAVCVGDIVEARISALALGLPEGGGRCTFFLTLHESESGREIARLPEGAPIVASRHAAGVSSWP